ncbi:MULTISPECIES: hypothetical protein [Idiomarina]|uniref:hypothetical protein n=1 Tax=Idiomarina TaxID=135575 RepID=UPI00129B7035|nr:MULTISPECIES: hypothetical protein [Idiomarina]MRJ40802.1 hypothetical protein [Idiomarina sp. FeN1]NCU56606.1 hypothetical protein [Idiomarina sp. FenA--70]NCU58986.1 hypothetical protein [Idiomarina sp. FenBw--71]UUN14517.1 hypothetical protein KGF88_04700 [Idiomarina loihiensis]
MKCYNIPILGLLIKFANAYVLDGRPEYTTRIAPNTLWLECIFKDVFYAALMSLAAMALTAIIGFNFSPSSVISDVFPDFIGFALGAYALTFLLPYSIPDHVFKENESLLKSLPFNFGYPLSLIVVVLLLNSIFKPSEPGLLFNFIFGTAMFYCFILVIEIIELVGNLGRSIVSHRMDDASAPSKDDNKRD